MTIDFSGDEPQIVSRNNCTDMERNLTDDEEQALQEVKMLLSDVVDPSRIKYGNATSYFAILLDGNSRNPVCRIYFKNDKYIGTFNTRKVETISRISSTAEISKFSSDIMAVVQKYLR